MSREVVAILYYHKYLISLVRLDRQRKLLMRADVKRREIWEWSDHTPMTMKDVKSVEDHFICSNTCSPFPPPVPVVPQKTGGVSYLSVDKMTHPNHIL
jgi:hypothetical protein